MDILKENKYYKCKKSFEYFVKGITDGYIKIVDIHEGDIVKFLGFNRNYALLYFEDDKGDLDIELGYEIFKDYFEKVEIDDRAGK